MHQSLTPIRPLLFFIVLSLLLSACGAAATPQSAAYDMATGEGAAPAEPMRESVAFDQSAPLAQDVERIVIKNANLEIVVPDPGGSMERISTLAEEMGGYVVNANLSQQKLDSGIEVPRASVTIRIPAEKLGEALDRIHQESDREPLSETLNSEDVTSQYTDLQSRLRNLENAEKQLQEIMGSATKTEDVLSVYSNLVSVREQIEVIKGQIQYYEQSAALSAITVNLIADEAVKPLTIGGWEPVGVAKQALQALINALKFIANAAIWVIILVLPVALVLYVIFVLPFRLVVQAWRRRRKAKQQAIQTPEPPQATPPAG